MISFDKVFHVQVCIVESVLDKSYVVGHVMVLYSPNWTNIGFSFILLTINLFRHHTLIEHGL